MGEADHPIRRDWARKVSAALTTPLPMASGTPFPERGAQPAQSARLANLATPGLAILPGRAEAQPVPPLWELRLHPPG